ncbi:MAG: branched-chain amino acid ABC transporter permease [Chloroflexi bacterium]|nr:branched-chain amino acid ABC transporter permease [Chloroflexota bacterium]
MAQLLQLVVNGLAMGCIYALIAMGFIITYNAVGLINFAQGELVMLGAFLAVAALSSLQLPLALAYLLSMVGMVAFGYVFQLTVFRPLQQKPLFTVIVATIGVSIILKNVARIAWGPEPMTLAGFFSSNTFDIGGVIILQQSVFIIVVTSILLVAQHLFFTYTIYGKRMRAVAQNQEVARLMGISVGQLIALSFILSALLGGIAGLLLAPVFLVTLNMGGIALLKAFAACILGGFGSIPGAVVGGLFLGVTEILMAAYVSSAYKDVLAFVILILVLLAFPRGLFGEKVGERA